MKSIAKTYTLTADVLPSGSKLALPPLSVKTEKHLSFTCDVPSLGEGKITVGHGKDISSGSWIEIDAEYIRAFAYYEYTDPKYRELIKEPIKHGFDSMKTVSVVINSNPHARETFAIVSTNSGMIKFDLFGWDGVAGEIFAMAEGTEITNCRLNWFTDGFSRKIWILGDSYSGIGHSARWPYYLYRDGFNNCMISGFPGMPSERAIEEFCRLVEMGAPEYAIWTLGMNNADKDGKISEGYLRSTERFLEICKERGITPILSTIPNCPKVNNRQKNEWVRSQPYRYIDFARAVGSTDSDEWYAGMLFTDEIHPATKGAEALYMQFLCDFPEIMQASNT
ncbi:MAG: SGNH/GDSL hydrolase family protein [Clostridia bacterium]|nr:SGNH/GDSL hydrolase family protein [Clostridia bacterium]